jgi:hypothetical protein
MDKALGGRSLTWVLMAALAVAVIGAGLARGLDAWHGVLVILGTALQVGAVAYATRSVWLPKARMGRASLVAWFRRRVLRRASAYADAATAIASVSASGLGRRGTAWPKAGQSAQITALMRWVDTLVADVDALQDRVADVEAGSVSALAAGAAQLEKNVERQFRLTTREAFVAGVLAVLGALLTLIAEFVT